MTDGINDDGNHVNEIWGFAEYSHSGTSYTTTIPQLALASSHGRVPRCTYGPF